MNLILNIFNYPCDESIWIMLFGKIIPIGHTKANDLFYLIICDIVYTAKYNFLIIIRHSGKHVLPGEANAKLYLDRDITL